MKRITAAKPKKKNSRHRSLSHNLLDIDNKVEFVIDDDCFPHIVVTPQVDHPAGIRKNEVDNRIVDNTNFPRKNTLSEVKGNIGIVHYPVVHFIFPIRPSSGHRLCKWIISDDLFSMPSRNFSWNCRNQTHCLCKIFSPILSFDNIPHRLWKFSWRKGSISRARTMKKALPFPAPQ